MRWIRRIAWMCLLAGFGMSMYNLPIFHHKEINRLLGVFTEQIVAQKDARTPQESDVSPLMSVNDSLTLYTLLLINKLAPRLMDIILMLIGGVALGLTTRPERTSRRTEPSNAISEPAAVADRSDPPLVGLPPEEIESHAREDTWRCSSCGEDSPTISDSCWKCGTTQTRDGGPLDQSPSELDKLKKNEENPFGTMQP